MANRPIFIDPEPGTTIDTTDGEITFRWTASDGPHVKAWWLSVGGADGAWDIRNKDKQKNEEETISANDLPKQGRLYAQVYGKVDGKDALGNPTGHDDEIQSDPVWWNCSSHITGP